MMYIVKKQYVPVKNIFYCTTFVLILYEVSGLGKLYCYGREGTADRNLN